MSLLDDIVLSSALNQARRLLDRGYDAETAADCACPGAWRIYRQRVLDKLLAEKKIKARQPGPTAKDRPR